MAAVFSIYIKDFMRGSTFVSQQTLLQEIPASSENALRLISPIVKNEMGNAESFEFSIEAGTPFYDAFLQMKTFILVKYDNDTIFYGRVIAISNNSFRQTRKIRCEGAFAFFLDTSVEGVEESKRPTITVNQYMQQLIANHNSFLTNPYPEEPNKRFALGIVPGQDSSISAAQRIPNESRAFGADSWTDTKGALEDLRSHYGGYFRTRLSGGIGSVIYLDWIDQYFNSAKNQQTIQIGKNILDISNDLELENIFTAIIPIGRQNVPSGSSDGKSTGTAQTDSLYLSPKVLKVPDIVGYYGDALNFGYHTKDDYQHAIDRYGMIIKTVTFQEADTAEKLLAQARAWIKNNYQGEVKKFTIKAIDMHQIGENTTKIMVGDRVEIIYRVGDENGNFSDKHTIQTCLSISYDLYHPENNSYTFGVPANILTKTYGVKKQARGKSDTGITSPPHASSGGGGSNEKKWINVVAGWLMRHQLRYHGPKPYNEEEHGSSFQSGGYMLQPSAHLLVKAIDRWYATIAGMKSPIVDSHGNPLSKPWDMTATAWIKKLDLDESTVLTHELDTATAGLASYTSFNEATVYDYKVCEYVLSEYGIDLRTCLEVKAPKTITTNEGEEVTFNEEINEETGLPEYVRASMTDGHKTGKFGPDGEEIMSIQDEEGNWHYFYQDSKTGEIIETSIRTLSIDSLDSKKKVGWVVTETQDELGNTNYDLNPETMPGQITTAIENRLGGEVVVTRVSGEEMFLGNKSTQFITQTSVNHMDSVCGMVDYTPDPNDPTRKMLYVDSGGGMRIWHAKKKPDGTYEYDEHGNIKYATFGIYDQNTLTGGMITEHLADGSVVTTISGNIVNIDATQVKAGSGTGFESVKAWLQKNGKDIDDLDGFVTPKITTLEATVGTIVADYITTGNIRSTIGDLASVIAKNIYITAQNGYIASPSFRTSTGGADYKGFTLNLGSSVSHNFLAQSFNPGPGVISSSRNVGLRAEELTGSDAGKIKISFTDGYSSEGGDGNGAAVFNIAATKKYKDDVAASWNNARSASITIIPTDAISPSTMSDSAMNNLQIKRPKTYSEYYSSSGDNRYVIYNYSMSLSTFTRQGASGEQKAVVLKSLTSNNIVAAYNITEEWDQQKEDGADSVYAVLPEAAAINANVTGSVRVRSKTSTGKTGDYLNLGMALATYLPQGVSGTHQCVVVKNGNNVVGRYDVQTVYNAGASSVTLTTKSITANGTYAASSDGYRGYSSVTVNVPTGGSGTININTGNGSYHSSSLDGIAYALGTNKNNLHSLFGGNAVNRGEYYGFKVTCGSAEARYYYFKT